MASNAGFGFVGVLNEMVTKNKAGKACLSVPGGGFALPPLLIDPSLYESANASVAAVTDQGRLLVFPLKDLPELARGKGNKLINVPSAAFKAGEEQLVGAVALGEKDELLVHAGQRHLRLKAKDLKIMWASGHVVVVAAAWIPEVDRLTVSGALVRRYSVRPRCFALPWAGRSAEPDIRQDPIAPSRSECLSDLRQSKRHCCAQRPGLR